MSFTTANPIAIGDATEKADHDVLRDNNDWLLDTLQVQHEIVGTGGRQGRHRALTKYTGSGNVAANSAETAILTQTDSAFGVGLWLVVIAVGSSTTVRYNFSEWTVPNGGSSFTEYSSAAGNAFYKLYSSYGTGVPATPYVKTGWNAGGYILTLSVKPTAGAALYYTYAVLRLSQ